jgi:hypothetical protein
MDLIHKIWAGWKRIGGLIGDFVGRLILTLLYFTLVLPFGLITRLGRDPLDLRRDQPPRWIERAAPEDTLDEAGRLS